MLSPQRIGVGLVGVLLMCLWPQTAHSDPSGGSFVNEDNVVVWTQSSGASQSQSSPARQTRGQSGESAAGCLSANGVQVPCFQFGDAWRPDLQCYARVKAIQPPVTEAVWEGNTSGMIVECRIGREDGWNTGWDAWVGTAELQAPPDPEELARRAVARMQLRPIPLGTFPRLAERSPSELGYVGWRVWMWVDGPSDATWGPITRSVSERGYTVSATARVDKVVWDMGDGSSVTCGLGTPWQSIWTHNEASPDCGHVYSRDGEYTVTATSHWVIDWSGIGESGVLTMELSDGGTVRIAEVQVVNVNEP